uniref:B30.2/SPRY domain-containing protein n=1 Tax=Gopherus agassizii TaxID=38772 RepID=A0A452IIQ7_9SAUR
VDTEVNVTLDPDTAHPELTVSEDRKSVRWGDTQRKVPDNPKRFDTEPCVLGCEGFTSGRHYWEVEVGDGGCWAVGVARESVRWKEEISHNPEGGIWILSQCVGEYWTALPPGEKLRRFGVYLDYERGQLCFYNAENMAHIHTFNATFRERIFPFFRILAKGTRIKICT